MRTLHSIHRWMVIALLAAPMQADCCKNAVAVIASISGIATVRSPGSGQKVAVSSLDWISDGATLEVGPRSQVVLILLNGHRYELDERAKATLHGNAAPKITGTARELPALPPIPRPAPIAAESAPTSGSVRVRDGGPAMSGLYPRAGAVAFADKATLHYKAVPEAISYRVVLEDDGGNVLLNVTTESTEVTVPTGPLHAGAHYYWRVLAMRSGVEMGAGMAGFRTLSAEDVLQRTEFASALRAKSDDPASLALLAAVDLQLGLFMEACDEFGAVLKQRPDDPDIQRELAACVDLDATISNASRRTGRKPN